jgi:hypothetical protein
MRITDFRITEGKDGTRLRAQLFNSDGSGEINRDGGRYIKINDLDAQMAVTPKFAQAWDMIYDVMGLAYDFYVLRDKVDEAMSRGEDVTDLIAARNAALLALREPV